MKSPRPVQSLPPKNSSKTLLPFEYCKSASQTSQDELRRERADSEPRGDLAEFGDERGAGRGEGRRPVHAPRRHLLH